MTLSKLRKFLPVAEAIAALSKDRSTKVGALVLGPGYEIRSVGYNGFPRGVNDNIHERHERPAKYSWVAHAESNAVAQAARMGVSLEGCTLIVTSLFPCTSCACMVIQAGISRVLAPRPTDPESIWTEQAKISAQMFAEAGVEVHYI